MILSVTLLHPPVTSTRLSGPQAKILNSVARTLCRAAAQNCPRSAVAYQKHGRLAPCNMQVASATPFSAGRQRPCSVEAAELKTSPLLRAESALCYSDHSTRNESARQQRSYTWHSKPASHLGCEFRGSPWCGHSIAWHSVEVLAVRGFCSVSREYITPHFTARPRRMRGVGAPREERGRESDSESHNVVRRAGSR